jgi:signal transduction histidine kinase
LQAARLVGTMRPVPLSAAFGAPLGLRFQLALLVAAAIVASLALAMTGFLSITRKALEDEARKSAGDAAEEIARDLQRLPPVDDEAIGRRLEQAAGEFGLADVALVVSSGEAELASLRQGARADGLARRHLETLASNRGARTIGIDAEHKGHPRHSGTASSPFSGHVGKGELRVVYSLDKVDEKVTGQARDTVRVAALAVLIAVLFMVLIADGLVGRPLALLARTMGEVSRGALSRRVESRGPPEVRFVSESFNEMLDKLEKADREVRSFNERLEREVAGATQALSEQNAALAQLNALLVRAREDLAHRERLAALGQLAAQLAHEVGTPLGSVSGHLQLALATGDVPEQTRERLVIATQEIQRVSRIIRDYLDSTRRMDPEVTDVEVERVMRESVDVARGGHPTRAAAVAVEVAPGVARWRTDEGVVRQVLVNLVANALDAVSQKGEGHVRVVATAEERQGPKGPGGAELVLTVADTGIGLSPEQLGRMFEPFYTTKGRGKGTGLGLAICRELAPSLGGRIEAASEPGRGTTFTVRLPPGDEAVRRSMAGSASRATSSGVH